MRPSLLSVSSASPNPICEARAFARQLIEVAKRESAQTIKTAKEEAEKIRQSAMKRGFAEGKEIALGNQLSALRLQKKAISRAREFVLDSVKRLAREVIGKELRSDPGSLKQRIERAESLLNDGIKFSLCINEVDKEIAEETVLNLTNAEVKTDPALSPGNFRLESSVGTILSDTDKHLEKLLSLMEDQR